MQLVKKTVILTSAGADGYLSVIRVGSDVGAKIVSVGFKKGMLAGIKVGREKPIFIPLIGAKTEIDLPQSDFRQTDEICCVVVDGDRLVARGGRGLSYADVVKNFSAPTAFVKTEVEQDNINEGKNFWERLSSGQKDFYRGVREKLEEMFVVYPTMEKLGDLIPDSSWIKINYDKEDYYVVGRVTKNGKTTLIGYGVPSKKNARPPKIADGIASYFTVGGIEPFDGVWLIFQDAENGRLRFPCAE